MINEKEVSYSTTNSYSTLHERSDKTKNVWVVFHGIGYLSRYFLKYFRHLNHEENYIIAPQAPSKYYLDGKYEHVGASWATRENTETEMENVMSYLDEIYEKEALKNAENLVLFGYSQGVSIASRWVARRKLNPSQLIFHSGRVPQEIEPKDLQHLQNCRTSFVYGTEDPFIKEEFLQTEKERLKILFPDRLEFLPFDGGHEVNKEIIQKLAGE
ncbi:MAG: esterase [Salinimicrobium sp.]